MANARSKLLKKEKVVYNQFHNILTLLDVLTNFSLATSKTMCSYYDYYLKTWYIRVASQVAELLKTHSIFAAGSALPTQEKKKTWTLEN